MLMSPVAPKLPPTHLRGATKGGEARTYVAACTGKCGTSATRSCRVCARSTNGSSDPMMVAKILTSGGDTLWEYGLRRPAKKVQHDELRDALKRTRGVKEGIEKTSLEAATRGNTGASRSGKEQRNQRTSGKPGTKEVPKAKKDPMCPLGNSCIRERQGRRLQVNMEGKGIPIWKDQKKRCVNKSAELWRVCCDTKM